MSYFSRFCVSKTSIFCVALFLISTTISLGQNALLFFVDGELLYNHNIKKIEIAQNEHFINYGYDFPNIFGDFNIIERNEKANLILTILLNQKESEFILEVNSDLFFANYLVIKIYTKENNRCAFPFEDELYLFEYDSNMNCDRLARKKFSLSHWILSLFK